MAVWLTSDSHLGHRLVSGLRGFASTDEHDWAILQNVRTAIKGDHDPEIWWLGDIAFDGWRERIKAIGAIPGSHHLVVGNHDRISPEMSRAHAYQRDFLEVFDSVHLMARLSCEGQRFVLSHYPYSGDSQKEDRDAQWRVRDLGKPILHGHTHSHEKFTLSDKGTPQIHVGLDAHDLRPIRLAEAVKILRKERSNAR